MDKNMYTSFRFWRNTASKKKKRFWRNTHEPIICKKNDKSIINFIMKALQTKK